MEPRTDDAKRQPLAPPPEPTTPMASSSAPSQSAEEIRRVVAAVRRTFDSGRTRPLAWRLAQLAGIRRMVEERQKEIEEAVHADLGRPALESFAAEIMYVRNEVDYLKKRLPSLMRPKKRSTPIVGQPGSSQTYEEPLGVVLIIAPWNYPFQLVVGPLVGALAAGNCAILKPSELAPRTAAMMAAWLPQYVDPDAVKLIEGGVAETTTLLEEKFDHIFYTGNGHVGRIVMTAAAKHLTPVTLELGGKSPVIVDPTADLAVTAKRIVWGKFFNAGQTCIAPDYVLVDRSVHRQLVDKMRESVIQFFGSDPKRSPDFGRIVNVRHHRRLMRLMESGKLVVGGAADEAERYIAPTILDEVSPDSPAMQEEIFGPILPVIPVDSTEAAIAFVNARPKPLALYLFSSSGEAQERVLTRTSSGGVCVNHVLFHNANPELPFGGVGESGMGAYHGLYSFEVFSHRKAVMRKPTIIDPSILYPPFSADKEKWLRRLL